MTRPGTAIVVMGVSASGKSVVGIEIARRLHLPFVDADDLHPAENVAKMSQGIPLTDADRMPWLDLVGDRLAHQAGRALRHGRDYATATGRTLRQDLSEYLTEEARLLPTRPELERFHADVDILRDDAERLQAQLQRLERRLSESE